MSVSRSVMIQVFGADGAAATGLTINSDFFAWYSINGGDAVAIEDADEKTYGTYVVSVSADPTDEVVVWGVYSDGTTDIPLTGIPIGPWQETIPTAAQNATATRQEMDTNSTRLDEIDAQATAAATAALTAAQKATTMEGDYARRTDVQGPNLGGDQCTLTWTNSTTNEAVADGEVWVSSDSAGTVRSLSKMTNSLGQAVFDLTDGNTYYFWARKDGVNPINGRSFVASKDA